MPDVQNQHETFPRNGGRWEGLDETGETSEVVDCLNVDFDPIDGVRRRLGRALLGTLAAGMRVSGLFEYVNEAGARRIFAGLQYDTPTLGDPKFGEVSAVGGFTDFVVPEIPGLAEPSRGFFAVPYKERLIVTDPFARLLDCDGSTLSVLDAVQGSDAADSVPGARAYLVKPPTSRFGVVWRGKVVAIDGYRAGLSADSGDLTVPTSAIASGANVWPGNTYFRLATPEGDPLQGAAVQADLLVLFTRRCVALVDEDAISPVARIVERQMGCVAPRSIVSVGGDVIMYLSDRKVCGFQGGTASDISAEIRPTLERLVNWEAASDAVAVHVARRNEYRLWVPVNGARGNRLCLIYDYVRKRWRRYAGWYPWDTEARQAAHQPYDVTAAVSGITASGDEYLLTGDSTGRLWLEDVGEVDVAGADRSQFPAYFALRPIGNGEALVTYGEWRVKAKMDGSFVEGFALRNGASLEQQIVSALDGVVIPRRKVKRSLSRVHESFADVAAWGVDRHRALHDRVRIPFRVRATQFQPVLSLPGSSGATVDTAPGGIRSVEIAYREGKGRRGEH